MDRCPPPFPHNPPHNRIVISPKINISDESFCEYGEENQEDLADRRSEDGLKGGRDYFQLNLQNYAPIGYEINSEDEKSDVLDRSEDSSVKINYEDLKDAELRLRERVKSLQEAMAKLREDLVSEAALWKKQREEFQAHREQSDVLAFEEAITAAWANDPLDMMSVDSAFETFTILEYEKNLARYQNDLAVAHAERRYNVRRQLVATNYRRKLMEVERLCDEELEKIKHNASCLQPLRQIASQWFTNQRSHGDSNLDIIKCSDDRGSADHTDGKNPQDKTSDEYRKIDAEVNMAPEIFAARFNIGDSDVEGNF